VIKSDALWLLCLVLAVARVIRFIVDDYLFKDVQKWIMTKFGEKSKITYLVHCTWCTGIWASLLIVPGLGYFGRGHWWGDIPVLFLAVAMAAPALMQIGEMKPQIVIQNKGSEGDPWR
jgi:hypothetical protein